MVSNAITLTYTSERALISFSMYVSPLFRDSQSLI
jgi:hypothetical protein